MSEENNKNSDPIMKAGDAILDHCPICKMGFEEKVETNKTHQCPNPECKVKFNVIVIE